MTDEDENFTIAPQSSEYVFSLSPKPQTDSNADWDRYSENVKPTRRGRRIDALYKTEVVNEKSARIKLEETLRQCSGALEASGEPDALSIALDFCLWFETHFTIGHHRLFYELLWKIVNMDKFIKHYEEDERMLKIWERLADNSGGHAHQIFQYAVTHKSLVRCATLYVRWSQSIEMGGAYVEARRVLLLAKNNFAVPLDIINDAEDQLEMRAIRRHINEKSSDEDEEETRVAFTRLGTIGESGEVPIVRLPSLVTDTSQSLKSRAGSHRRKPDQSNEVRAFEVFEHANEDEDNYLMHIHELNVHADRFAIRECAPRTTSIDSSQAASTSEVLPLKLGDAYEVWTGKKNVAEQTADKNKTKFVVKKIFKTVSFEEYVAENVRIELYANRIVKKLDFDESI